LPPEVHQLGVQIVDHPGLDLLARRPVEAPARPRHGHRRLASGGEPLVDQESHRAGRRKQRGMREQAVLPEEIPVAGVLDLGERQALLVYLCRDDIAVSLAVTKEYVLRRRARRVLLVERAFVARQLALQICPRPAERSAQRAPRLRGTGDRWSDEALALERLESELEEDLVRGRRGRRVQDRVIAQLQDGREQR